MRFAIHARLGLGDVALLHRRCPQPRGVAAYVMTVGMCLPGLWYLFSSASPLHPPRRLRRPGWRCGPRRLPPDVPPTTTGAEDPRYAWSLVVETALVGCPDYCETFHVRVQAPDEAQ